jgi:hypothetical protein
MFIILAASPEEASEHWLDAEVALASLDREIFLKAKNLRWLQNTAAGADMLMFPEMVAGDRSRSKLPLKRSLASSTSRSSWLSSICVIGRLGFLARC